MTTHPSTLTISGGVKKKTLQLDEPTGNIVFSCLKIYFHSVVASSTGGKFIFLRFQILMFEFEPSFNSNYEDERKVS